MEQRTELERQLTYEQRLATRYRYFVSVVMISTHHEEINVKHLLRETLRECDEVYVLDGGVALLMPQTKIEDAYQAIERFKKICSDRIDLRFSIASYPADAAPQNLLGMAEERLAARFRGPDKPESQTHPSNRTTAG